MRQQAVWHWLRREAAGKALFAGHSPACDTVDLKEAVRLMLMQPLAELLQSIPSPGGHSPTACRSFTGSMSLSGCNQSRLCGGLQMQTCMSGSRGRTQRPPAKQTSSLAAATAASRAGAPSDGEGRSSPCSWVRHHAFTLRAMHACAL